MPVLPSLPLRCPQGKAGFDFQQAADNQHGSRPIGADSPNRPAAGGCNYAFLIFAC